MCFLRALSRLAEKKITYCFLAGILAVLFFMIFQVTSVYADTAPKDIPAPKDVVIVLDVSYSQSFLQPTAGSIENVVASTLDVLKPCKECRLGLIVFSGAVSEVIPLKPVMAWNKADFKQIMDASDQVKRISGSNYAQSLELASKILSKSDAYDKRIVMLSDGSLQQTVGLTGTLAVNEVEKTKASISQTVRTNVIPAGAHLMTVMLKEKSGIFDSSRAAFWQQVSELTDGWYINAGIEVDINQKLSWAAGNTLEECDMTQRPQCEIEFDVDPFTREIRLQVGYSGSIDKVFVVNNSHVYSASIRSEDNLILFQHGASPAQGKWTMRVSGTGKIRFRNLETQPRKVTFKRSQAIPQVNLLYPQPLEFQLDLLDENDEGFPRDVDMVLYIPSVELRSGSSRMAATQMMPSGKTGFRVVFTPTYSIAGAYDIVAQTVLTSAMVGAKNAPMTISRTLGNVLWEQPPKFAGKPQIIGAKPKAGDSLRVGVKLENMADMPDGQPLVDISATFDDGSILLPDRNGQLCHSQCLFTFTTSSEKVGVYTITAVLQPSYTRNGAQIKEGVIKSESLVAAIEDKNFLEKNLLLIIIFGGLMAWLFVKLIPPKGAYVINDYEKIKHIVKERYGV